MTGLQSVFLQLIKWSILEKIHCLVLQSAAVNSTAVLVFYWAVLSGSGISGTIHSLHCCFWHIRNHSCTSLLTVTALVMCHCDQLLPASATLHLVRASIRIPVQAQRDLEIL